jgi:hypothetical protein
MKSRRRGLCTPVAIKTDAYPFLSEHVAQHARFARRVRSTM